MEVQVKSHAGTESRERGSRREPRIRRDWKELTGLLESLPPHAIEAEISLLGSMLIDPQVIGDVLQVIRTGDDFFKPAHTIIFDALVGLYDRHAAADIVQLNQALLDAGALETVGGLDYLARLAEAVPTATNATHYARLVREKSMVRRLISAAGDILQEAYDRPDDVRMVLEEAERRIFQIVEHSDQSKAETIHSLMMQMMGMLEAQDGRPISGVKTGFHDLDEMTGGLQHGDMIILAARPSMGKTALALNIAEQVALSNVPVGVFSLEMSKQQLVQRVLAARAGIDAHRLRRNLLRKDEHTALMTACDQMFDAPLYIDDTPGLTLLQLRAKARRLQQKHQIKFLVIDYLQLMVSGRKAESRQVEVSEISRGVKAMARELEVPVLCLSQLNRSPEERTNRKPMMSDLRESGSIEQDADVVALLHREDYYHKDDPDWEADNPDKAGVAELILAKQRNGPTGVVKMAWVASSMRFRDYSNVRPTGGYIGQAHRGRASAPSVDASPPFRTHAAVPVWNGPGGRPGNDDDERSDAAREPENDIPGDDDGIPI